MPDYISIDQNSNTLWDTVPKLAALARHGCGGMHCVEDIDMAFTRRGGQLGDESLEVVRERYYRGGVSDWGATLFYSDFLGRLPLDVTALEPYTGWTTAALTRRLGCTVDELYDRYSPSDNWQLVGTSYVGDSRFHRVIGDLSVASMRSHLLALLGHMGEDLHACFPEAAARARIDGWLAKEEALVRGLIDQFADSSLAALYREWMRARLPVGVDLRLTSEVFSIENGPTPMTDVLEWFVRDYERLVALYNEAVEEGDVGVHPLHAGKGELPFFVVARRDGHMVRTGAVSQEGKVVAGDWEWPTTGGKLPLARMREDGVVCLAGKALLLVLQVRMGATGRTLALPHMGSLYMPAAYALERRLRKAGVLAAAVRPVQRVHLGFFDAWRGCRTVVRVPEYLQGVFSAEELPADELADELATVVANAESLLNELREAEGRGKWQRTQCPELWRERDQRETQRREMVRGPHDRNEVKALYERVKELDRQLLEALTEAVVRALRVRDLPYYDSRGALLPWSIALGGEPFYDELLSRARIVPETADDI